MKLLIDNASWCDVTDAELLASMDVPVISKSSQGYGVNVRYVARTERVIDAGGRPANYHWIDPLLDPVLQADTAIELADRFGIKTIAGDTEQWWSNWDAWYAWIQRIIPASDVPKLPASRIQRATEDFHNRLVQRNYNDICYTRWSFIKEWCPGLTKFVESKDQWLAEYPLKKGDFTITWKEAESLCGSYNQIFTFDGPSMIWQMFGDRYRLPGTEGLIDLNKWQGTDTQWEHYFPHISPPVVKDYRMTNLNPKKCIALYVRSKPTASSTALRAIVAPVKDFPIYKTLYGVWAKLYDEPGYVHSGYLV